MHDLNWVIDAARTIVELQTEATLRGIATAGVRKEALRQLVAAHEMARLGGTPPVPPTVPPISPPVPPPTPLRITTAPPLRVAQRGVRYSTRITATVGTGTKHWTVEDLPDGLHWRCASSNTIEIHGKPREDGTFHPRVTVDDDSGVPATQVFDLRIRDNPGTDRDYDRLRSVAGLFLLGALIAASVILAIWAIAWAVNNVDFPESRDDDTAVVPKPAGTPDNGSGKLTIGGLEINNDGQYQNGVGAGEIRPDVPDGYLVVGDATVNGHAPDSNPTTGQIVVLMKPAIVIGTNESSLQRLGSTSWQQAVKVKATEMRLNGCMGGCATVLVYDQDGNKLTY